MASKMTATEVAERTNKTLEDMRKLNTLICKREKALPKAQKELAKYNKETQWSDWFDAYCKVENLEDGIEGVKKKLAEKQKTLEKWNKKLEEINAENKKLDEIPEQLKKLQHELAEKIINYRIAHREQMYKDDKEMSYEDFRKKYSYREEEYYMGRSDGDFKQMVTKDANAEAKGWVLNLISRVEKKVGEITEWKLWFATNSLNGYVGGTKGTAVVETILAGGYNIQCLHNRVLVK